MTIASEIARIGQEQFELGTGPDARPWAVDRASRQVYALSRRGDLAQFRSQLKGVYHAQTGQVPGDVHVKSAVETLVALAQRGEPLDAVTEADVARGAGSGPGGTITDPRDDDIDLGRGEVDVVRAVLAELRRGRDDIFVSGTTLARVVRTDQGRVQVQPMAVGQDFVNWCDGRLRFYITPEDADGQTVRVEKFLPVKLASMILRRADYPGVLPLVGISHLPVLRPDGTIAVADGYDPASGLYLDVDDDLKDLSIPEHPTRADVEAAIGQIQDLYAGFPFVDPADRANAVGFLLSVVLKPMFPKLLVPIHAVGAGVQGSGKTLVAQDIPGAVAGGHDSPTFQGDEKELRKLITATLMTSTATVACFDNIQPGTVFESAVLAQLVTATVWNDRELGRSHNVYRPQDRLWSATGNNLRIGPDLRARTVLIRLDVRDVEDPASRRFEVRLDDPATLTAMRPDLLRACLTVARSWVLAGMPRRLDGPVMRQFTEWSQLVGGLLEHVGITGHLGNQDALVEVDETTASLGVLLRDVLYAELGSDPFTTEQAVEVLDRHPEHDEHLPTWLQEKIRRGYGFSDDATGLHPDSRAKLQRSLASTFRNNRQRYYAGVRVEQAGRRHAGYATWRLHLAPTAGEGGESGDSAR